MGENFRIKPDCKNMLVISHWKIKLGRSKDSTVNARSQQRTATRRHGEIHKHRNTRKRSLLFNLLNCHSDFSWDDTQWARALFWDHEGKELHSCRQESVYISITSETPEAIGRVQHLHKRSLLCSKTHSKAPVATVFSQPQNPTSEHTTCIPAPQTPNGCSGRGKRVLCSSSDGHMRSIAVVCTLQMMKTLQYSQSQQDDFAPSVFHIVVITRSTEMQIKLQSLQVERYTLLLPLCTDLHFLLPLTHQELRLELQELVACSQQDCSKG
ncbi:hypothetical protein QQF64_035711 [Cirrhinus molitorella]|uniref:Uncharacterized protein n=1 Tax=Cirrhinus molitorella TaxID=172907 RepID=A0ABR3NGI5_9TELE